MNASSTSRIWAIVPAAGDSLRMGRPKPAMPFGDSTMIATVVGTLSLAGVDRIVVVTKMALQKALRLPEQPSLIVCFNDAPHSDMLGSLRIAFHVLKSHGAWPADGVLVVPADMPTLTSVACRACMAQFRRNPDQIVIASYESRPGHPILFPYHMAERAGALPGGLRQLRDVFPNRVSYVPCDPSVLIDVDTPADYEHLQMK